MSEELVVQDAEIVEAAAPPTSVTLFGTDDPDAFIEHATKSAKALAAVVKTQKLTVPIQGREHVRVEGWTLLGSMLGVFPVCVWTRQLEDGWEARVEARTRSGEIVGAAEAECLRSESLWKSRDDYALRSMAQTRATSKALRQPLGFVMSLAGYDATPAEEMDGVAKAKPSASSGDAITDPQMKKIHVLLKKLEDEVPTHEGQLSWKAQLRSMFGVRSAKDLSKEQAGQAIEWLEQVLNDAHIPF